MKRIGQILAVMCALLLAACGGNGGAGAGGGDSTVTIGYQNNGSIDPAQASLSLGLYQKYITGGVKLVYFDSGPASLTALGSGDVDIMTGIGNPPVASAIANKVPVSVIWAEELGQTDQALVVKKDSGITSVAGLKGKEIATVVGSTSAYALSAVLKKNGLSDKDVTVRNMDPQTMRTAWTKGQISAAYIWYPVLGKLLAENAVKLADNTDVEDVAPIYNFSVVNKTWATSHAESIKQFIQAQDEGVKAFRNDTEATLTKMIKDTNETMEEAVVASKTARSFNAAEQLGPDALGKDDQNSLVATSLLAASAYLRLIDSSSSVLKPADVPIDRSYVLAYLKSNATSKATSKATP